MQHDDQESNVVPEFVMEETPRSYFTQIPNIVDDMNLKPHTFRLYACIRRIAGEKGSCWASAKTLAEHCSMSVGQVSISKHELADCGLIRIEEVPSDKGKPFHRITVVDIWRENQGWFERGCSYSEQPPLIKSHSDYLQSHSDIKKNTIKKNPVRADENFEKETTDDLMNGLTTVNNLLQNSTTELWQGKDLPEELQGTAYRKNGGASKDSSAAEPGLSMTVPAMSREDIARTRAAQALANGMARVANSGIDTFLGRVPEHIRPLARAYCECVERPPVKEEESRWRSAWKTQYELHLTPDDVTNTYNKMMREGLTVASPASVTGIADSDRRKSIFDTQNKCSEADDSRAKRMPDSLDRFRIGNKVFDRADVLAMTDDEWAVAQGNAIYEDMMAHCGPIEETE